MKKKWEYVMSFQINTNKKKPLSVILILMYMRKIYLFVLYGYGVLYKKYVNALQMRMFLIIFAGGIFLMEFRLYI